MHNGRRHHRTFPERKDRIRDKLSGYDLYICRLTCYSLIHVQLVFFLKTRRSTLALLVALRVPWLLLPGRRLPIAFDRDRADRYRLPSIAFDCCRPIRAFSHSTNSFVFSFNSSTLPSFSIT